MRPNDTHSRIFTRLRRGVIRTQLLALLLLSSTSGMLAEQLWDRTDKLAAEYQGLADDGGEEPGAQR